MKRIIILLLAGVLMLTATACNGGTDNSEAPESTGLDSTSAAEETPAPEPEPESSSELEASEPAQESKETAEFSLGPPNGMAEVIGIGDTIGEWTLADLQIQYRNEQINELAAVFAGDVTIKGYLSPSNLLPDEYDFRVTLEDADRMPWYVSPEMEGQDILWLMPDIPDELLAALNVEDETLCSLTVSEYSFTFAYRTSPAGVKVVDIEIL